MYINSAYLNNSLVDFKDKSKPLVVGSCGTYHLYTRPKLPTYRQKTFNIHMCLSNSIVNLVM